jgi:hypothetical protein
MESAIQSSILFCAIYNENFIIIKKTASLRRQPLLLLKGNINYFKTCL